jgi:putative pyruvate formate lyase activating enzyme
VTPREFSKHNDINDLWKSHDSAAHVLTGGHHQSLMDLKIVLAEKIFCSCHFCEQRCGVDRHQQAGNCGVTKAGVASEFLHYGEENILVPSYTIFFSGCPFHCVYCQNWDISQEKTGLYIEPDKMAKMIEITRAKNVNWVGGDPTPNLHYILDVLNHCTKNIPQIWNSNMYCSLETMRLLNDVMDVYLTDFKYGNDTCAKRLSKVERYWEVITRNHMIAAKHGEVLIRHLVLPNHIECCSKPALHWIADNVPEATVNIMAQYRPQYKAYHYQDIARPLSNEEYMEAVRYGHDLGLHQI